MVSKAKDIFNFFYKKPTQKVTQKHNGKMNGEARSSCRMEAQIDHFIVAGLVTWRLNDSEAGGDLVLIHTSLLLLARSSCSYPN